MTKNKKYIQLFITCISFFAFTFSHLNQAIHQLEHINDVVCISFSKHYHTQEHNDLCKDINFFPLQNFYEIQYGNFFVYQIQKYNTLSEGYQSKYQFVISTRGPPLFFVTMI